VQAIPYPNALFDAVIANHMLYHVPDLPKALAEIQRVLKPGGQLYAATNGQHHTQELRDLVRMIKPDAFAWHDTMRFTLEDGADWLAPHFARVDLRRFPSYLLVTEAAPLIAYVCSMHEMETDQVAAFTHLVEQTLQAQGGAIRIQRDAGLFCAQNA
jgi:SAM-dependent methyltransferase